MSSTPGGLSFKEHNIANLPQLLTTIVSSSADSLPTEPEIDRLRKEVDDFYAATRKQANRYQRDLESLVSRHGTADQARRRDVQKSTAVASARQEEGNTCFRANGGVTDGCVDSGSDSDLPLRKKRKYDDTSRASTPRLSTPKGISHYSMYRLIHGKQPRRNNL